ncbi:MAG: hypothetical protein RIS90_75 [Pseudomonadota bacterium]|jgi:aspartate dehydrogenase
MPDDLANPRLSPARRRIGLIGHGRIGGIVGRALAADQCGNWDVAALLTRSASPTGDIRHHTDAERFFAVPVDLYLECAGPDALTRLGEAALQRADVWSVSGVALANDELRARLQATGALHGHRLRLVAAAAGGFDAVQTLAQAPGLELEIDIVAPERCASFHSPVREAARRLPHGVNLAVAAALAGNRLDETPVRLTADPDRTHHAISLRARSALGHFESRLMPLTDPARDLHVVAAGILAALRQADQVIWVG